MLLWIESLNSDIQQLHQYQQNEQPPLTLTHGRHKKPTTYDVGNSSPGLGQAQKCSEFIIQETAIQKYHLCDTRQVSYVR